MAPSENEFDTLIYGDDSGVCERGLSPVPKALTQEGTVKKADPRH